MGVRSVDVSEAKIEVSILVDVAAVGKEIVFSRNGLPLARLVAFVGPAAAGDRGFGSDPLPRDVLTSFVCRKTLT